MADDASPWALADGFRLCGAEPIEIDLARADEALSVRVWVTGDSAVRVELAKRSHELVLGRDTRTLELRPKSGGPAACALVRGDHIDIWREARHAEFRVCNEQAAFGAARHPVGSLTASLPGVVVSVHAVSGQRVAAGDALVVVEAMKMEHAIRAPQDGVIEAVHVRTGDRVREGDTLVTMARDERAPGAEPHTDTTTDGSAKPGAEAEPTAGAEPRGAPFRA
jgi:3-methylcrotonyl-CoA carboxylase alpha subunit